MTKYTLRKIRDFLIAERIKDLLILPEYESITNPCQKRYFVPNYTLTSILEVLEETRTSGVNAEVTVPWRIERDDSRDLPSLCDSSGLNILERRIYDTILLVPSCFCCYMADSTFELDSPTLDRIVKKLEKITSKKNIYAYFGSSTCVSRELIENGKYDSSRNTSNHVNPTKILIK